jgi:hypothetical protein
MLKQARGVIYMAMGKKYLDEAIFSAHSFRKHMKWPITIFTDLPEYALDSNVFNEIVSIQQSGPRPHRDKLVSMLQSPYDETLFLDTDTYIGASLDDCWSTLKYFDMVVSNDRGYKDHFPHDTGVPNSFKEVNLGVVFYRKSEKMINTFTSALGVYDELSAKHSEIPSFSYDQPSFRIAAYYSGIAIAPLAEEDNCRFATYGKLNGIVRVLHGRLHNKNLNELKMDRILKKLNYTHTPRVIVAGKMWSLLPSKIPAKKYKAELIRFNSVDLKIIVRTGINKLKRKLFKI